MSWVKEMVWGLLPLFTLVVSVLVIAGFSLDIQVITSNNINTNANSRNRAAYGMSIFALCVASLATLLVLVHWICMIPGNPLCGGPEATAASAAYSRLGNPFAKSE